MRYQPGEELQPHFDYLEPALVKTQAQRTATSLLYLNDDYVGGETHFVGTNQYLRGAAGDALFWGECNGEQLAGWAHSSAWRAPEEDTKWVFSQWIRDRSPAP
jgi:prolyl 4-hydroxylase